MDDNICPEESYSLPDLPPADVSRSSNFFLNFLYTETHVETNKETTKMSCMAIMSDELTIRKSREQKAQEHVLASLG